jgi:lipid-A-disaccharide synthase-like uncharacterized protein
MMEKFLQEIRADGFWWFIFGLAGQLAFTGRFVIQWLISEKKGKSVMPIFFWYLSLVGATMLLIYFIKRGEAVGAIGQSIGWLVYVRNIMLVRKETVASVERQI